MKWTPQMLNTLYIEANAINRWKGWTRVAQTISKIYNQYVSPDAARLAYRREQKQNIHTI